MKIILHGEEDLEFAQFTEVGMDLEPRDPDAQYSAPQMFATSLAICTYSVLHAYGEQIDTASDDIAIRVSWDYADRSRRIANIRMKLNWPALPDSRIEAAQRAAEHCLIHETLAQPPRVETRIESQA